MNLRDFKIGTRLAIGFGAILVVLVVTVVLANALNFKNKGSLMVGLELSTAKNLQAATMKSTIGKM